MNDAAVAKQLENMVSFIKKEAEEKAEEILAKAEEDFTIEKAKKVQAQKLKLMKEFERKMKEVEVQKKIAFSNEVNKSRLRILKTQEEAVQAAVNKASSQLSSITKNTEQYQTLVRRLLVEGMIKIDEPAIAVRCRQEDKSLVEAVLHQAEQDYKVAKKKDCKLSLDSKHHLAPATPSGASQETCAGGVVLSAQDGRILVNNTLDMRLKYAFEVALPEIRQRLFGDAKIPHH
jgi:V-type H+-transporting ATPase subunit E